MGCSTPGFPVLHHLPELAQTHVHWVSDAIQPSHPLSSPSPLALSLSQLQGLFQWISSLHQMAKVLELQLQQQFLQWRTGLILMSKWLSRVFSRTTVQKHQFFGAQPSMWFNSHILHDYWGKKAEWFAFLKCFLESRLCDKHFILIVQLIFPNNSISRYLSCYFPFHCCENGGPESLSKLPKVTQLVLVVPCISTRTVNSLNFHTTFPILSV